MKIFPDRSFKDVRILEKKTLFQGFSKVESYTLQHRMFNGEWTEVYQRELVVRLNAAAALLFDPLLSQVVLIEQFRVGALLRKKAPWLIEIVAGVMDSTEHESIEDLVIREVAEEAGLEVQALVPIFNYLSSPGASTESIQLFCAKVDSKKAPAFCGLSEEHEDIRVHVVSCKDAFLAVRNGEIDNAMAIIALQWLEMNLQTVRNMFEEKL